MSNADFNAIADQLIEAGKFLFSRGWVPATSGNFSARLPDGNIALTVSGRHKGRLTRDDILIADPSGKSSDARKPSAETPLHVELYKRFPDAGCVLHPHTVATTVLSRILPGGVTLSDYEVLKAFPGIDTHEASLYVPVFPNDQDTRRLARSVDSYLKIDQIIAAAEVGNVDAIHPGYGFLAENAHFAEICESCDIHFIFPS